MNLRTPIALGCIFALSGYGLFAGAEKEKGDETPPHMQALALILKNNKQKIREIELKRLAEQPKKNDQNWWLDAITRRWDIRRPMYSGDIDSRHLFYAEYSINGKVVAYASVDLKKSQAYVQDVRQKLGHK